MQEINAGKSAIKIGDHVWVSRGAAIISSGKTVSIGSGSVIGMNSLVTQSASSLVLLVGTPAVVLKQGISWARARTPSAREKQDLLNSLKNKL